MYSAGLRVDLGGPSKIPLLGWHLPVSEAPGHVQAEGLSLQDAQGAGPRGFGGTSLETLGRIRGMGPKTSERSEMTTLHANQVCVFDGPFRVAFKPERSSK